MLTSIAVSLVTFSAQSARLVAYAFFLITVSCGVYVANNFDINTDISNLISKDLPWRQRQITFDQQFPDQANLIVVVIDGQTPELAEDAAARLSDAMAQRSDLLKSVERPDGLPFFLRNGLLFLSTEDVQDTTAQIIAAQPLLGSLANDPSLRGIALTLDRILEGVARGEAQWERILEPLRALASSSEAAIAGRFEPVSWSMLITGRPPDTQTLRRFVLARPYLNFDDLQPGSEATKAIRLIARDAGLTPDKGVRVRLTGDVPLADEELASLSEGAALSTTLALILVTALLRAALYSVRVIIPILLTTIFGLIITTAFGLFLTGSFNLLSIAFAVLFVGLGIDFGIQYSVRYRAERFHVTDLAAALRVTAERLGTQMALAILATAIAFYAFLPTPYRGVSELGAIAGTGMLVAGVLTLTLLPALLRIFKPGGEALPIGFRRLAAADIFLRVYAKPITLAAALLLGGALSLIPQVRFDWNPLHLRNLQTESVSTIISLMDAPNSTPNTVEILFADIDKADAAAQKISALPEVANVITLSSFVPDDQDKKLPWIQDAAELVLPTLLTTPVTSPSDDEVAAALAHASERLHLVAAESPGGASPPADAIRLATAWAELAKGQPAKRHLLQRLLIPGLSITLSQLSQVLMATPVTVDDLPPDLVNKWKTADGRVRVQVSPKGNSNENSVLFNFVNAVQSIEPEVTGVPVSILESSRTIVESFIEAGIYAAAGITIMLLISLRSIVMTILTLLPVSYAIIITLAFTVIANMPLNFANIIALPLLFGIGVAFTIYYVIAWRDGVRDYLQSSLTHAVFFSALTTSIAFGSLSLSSHPGTASMGNLLIVSLVIVVLITVVVLPALLHLLPPPSRKEK